MKLSTITKSSLFSLASTYALNNEQALCQGECAQGMANTIASQGNSHATVVEVKPLNGRSTGLDPEGTPVAYQINTDSVFNTIKIPAKPEDFGADKQSARFGLVFKIPVINNYGCWCYGGESWPGARDVTGFGEPKDVFDDACKAHHMGFDCITMDAEAEGETCIPNETKYTLLVTPLANGDYTLECADSIETDWCKRRVCLVDIRFIARQWKLEADGIKPDFEAYGHPGFHNSQGNFDTSVCEVPTKPHTGNGNGGPKREIQKVCCGDYPYRIWYDKNNEKGISCCAYEDSSVISDYGFSLMVGQLYNSMSATCCNNGVVSGSNVCA